MGDLNDFEKIGLAFVCGVTAGRALDVAEKDETKEESENKEEEIETVEIKKVTPKEMGEIFDGLKKKIIGEEK